MGFLARILIYGGTIFRDDVLGNFFSFLESDMSR